MIATTQAKNIILLCLFIVLSNNLLIAQSPSNTDTDSVKNTILKLDQEFWKSYNTCDIETFKTFFIQDFEFYHDKGGLTAGLDHMMELVKSGLCGSENPRVRREVIEGSVNVYPLRNYGAIISGEHRFYITEKGKKERLTEVAKFTHVWQHNDKKWKMTRVLSYDHQPAPQNTDKKEISVTDEILAQYLGTYQAPKTGTVVVSKKGNLLQITAGKMEMIVYPQSKNLFFHKQSPLTFEFVKDAQDTTIKFIVRENGNIAEEAKKVK